MKIHTRCFILTTFFNSPTLPQNVFDRGIYGLGTVWSDRKSMTIMKKDKDVERGDVDFQYAIDMIAVKWFDNCWITMVGTFLEECNKVSTVTSRIKGQSAKIPVPYQEIIKDYRSIRVGWSPSPKNSCLQNGPQIIL